ncbi:formate dehydrogenase accessory sulfurtransferase FdhD, partial [bacterium]|nr:formate dehydrogenase accessory sulfurtransferase FdhD [bacterium]
APRRIHGIGGQRQSPRLTTAYPARYTGSPYSEGSAVHSDPRQHTLPITAAVLAGGRSMRMGVDKTLLDVDGEPIVARVTETVLRVCDNAVVVTNRPEALRGAGLPGEVPVLRDEIAYQGPLGGLTTAMAFAEHEWVLAVAADMPWLEPAVIRALWDVREGVDVVVPLTDKGTEPLLALYRVEACLPAARATLESGRRRLVAMFPALNVREVPISQLEGLDPGLRSFVNVNTPEDLAEVRAESIPQRTDPDAPVRLQVIEVGSGRSRGMPVEQPVTIYMNDVEVATVQATPTDLEEMAVGFLLAEGLLSNRDEFTCMSADRKRGLVYITTDEVVPDDMVHKTRYVTSGCGKGITFSSVGHARNLEKVTVGLRVDSEVLYDLMGQMSRAAAQYRDTGGTHAGAIARGGKVLVVREDVGRHNAVDKVLGRAWLDAIPTRDAALLTTGRISYEMAVKAAKARIPIVVSRTAVTNLAAEIAEELGITIVGYARGGKMVIYSHSERVAMKEGE